MPRKLNQTDAGFAADFDAFLAEKRETAADVAETVAAILEDVRQRGDGAVIDYTNRFDGTDFSAGDLRVSAGDIAAAEDACAPTELEALHFAAGRIEAYHRRQLPEDDRFTDAAGVELGHRWSAIDAVGLYVPGGLAAYPSSVLMNAIPARVAGVGRLAMCVPAPDGLINPLVLAGAGIAGIEEIYRIGGAQAIAAMTYGTRTVVAVDKIVGPGNAYVAAAKRQVFGQVGIDMIAGPSEILVLSDGDSDPDWIAADLLSQAEHDVAAQSILITDDGGFAHKVEAAVTGQLKTLPRAGIAGPSWRDHGAVIVVEDLARDAPALVNRIAPEHLEIALDDPESLFAEIRHAGTVFLGRHTPEAIGDYVAGTNHVLPTARSARFFSGLTVTEFLKRTSIVRCDAASLRQIGPAAVTLAEAEGLSAHARSLALRLRGAP